ncbi:MAG: hypothetical protein C4527_28725 [Candidatus Omnitrophota bacterium]|jgi:ABC-type transport system involved in multi-copper enzyme maturation permease subunit|nr:MAG: hypothetical protein C4527_28725 [Candidatus Omnitrophota bacterium]
MNPIIARELYSQLRRPRSFRTLFVLLLLAGGIFCLIHSILINAPMLFSFGGRNFFYAIVYLSCLLIIPISGMAAVSVVHEREENTLELLLTTPLKNVSFIWGKCLASVLYGLLIISSFLPMLGLCVLMGGVSPLEMIQCGVVILALYLLVTVIGVAISLCSRSSGMAMQLASLIVVLFLIGPIALKVFFLLYCYGNLNTAQFHFEVWINPILTLIELQNPGSFWNPARLGNSVFPSPFIQWLSYPGFVTGLFNLLFAIVLFLLTVYLFHKFRVRLTTPFSWKEIVCSRQLLQRSVSPSQIDPAIHPFFGLRYRAISEKEKKESNRKWLTRDSSMIIAVCLLTLLLIFYFYEMSINPVHYFYDFSNISSYSRRPEANYAGIYYLFVFFALAVCLFYSPIHSSSTLQREFQRETWPLLRITTLSSRDVVMGKVYAAFRKSMIPILFFYPIFFGSAHLFFHFHDIRSERMYVTEIGCVCLLFSACLFFYSCAGVMYSAAAQGAKASPHRKTFGLIILHLLFPFLVFVLFASVIMLIHFIQDHSAFQTWFPRSHFDWYVDLFAENIFPFSPLTCLFRREWDFHDYCMAGVHGVILIGLGGLMMRLTAARIQRRD